ncbi:hypothetical protein ACFQMM_13510 [Saliphagus sp. GCM10025308]
MERAFVSRRSPLTAVGSCALAGAGVEYASKGTVPHLEETLSVDIDLETRVQWHLAAVESLVGDGVVAADEDDETDIEDPDVDDPEEPEPESEPEPDDPDAGEPGRDPVAEIRTTPEDAAERTLSVDDTVELDASCSRAPEGRSFATNGAATTRAVSTKPDERST